MRGRSRNLWPAPCETPVASALQAWFRTPLGGVLETGELAALREILPTLFGYHLVFVDPPWRTTPSEGARIRNAWVLRSTGGWGAQLLGEAVRLPLRTDSLDALVLPHVLEFAADPHAILREADRCLVPEGHLLLFGFQPWGLWGGRRLLSAWRGRLPWCGRWLSTARVRDWCRLLGFEVLEVRGLCHALPVVRPRGSSPAAGMLERAARRGWPVPSAGWLLLARKRVIGLTPIRPRWRPRRSILSPLPGMAEPSRRDPGR